MQVAMALRIRVADCDVALIGRDILLLRGLLIFNNSGIHQQQQDSPPRGEGRGVMHVDAITEAIIGGCDCRAS
jgi:hypothetical protein